MFDDLLTDGANRIWSDYLKGDLERTRKQSLGVLRRFLSAIRQVHPKIKQDMTLRLCKSSVDDGINLPIREPLFDQLIFPSLLALHQEGERKATRYLASFNNFILKSEHMMTALENEGLSQIDLLKEVVTHDPNDQFSAEQLLSLWEQWFDYCVHQSPEFIYFRGKPATLEEIDLLLKELDQFEKIMRQAHEEKRFSEHLFSWRQQINEWCVE